MPASFPPIQALVSVAHKWVNAISGAGVPSATQPAATDISGLAASATTDTTNASNISSGTLAAALGGAGTVSGALKGNGSGVVSQAAASDLSNGTTGSGAVVLATAPTLTTLALSETASSAPQVNLTSQTPFSVANGANATLSGLSSYALIFIAESGSTGDIALYLVGNGVAIMVSGNGDWVAPTTSPAAGQFSVDFASGAYRVYNNVGGTASFRAIIIAIG